MITKEILLENKYLFYKSNKPEVTAHIGTYQKKITDENGIKYFITIEHWDFRKLGISNNTKESFETHLNTDIENDNYMSVILHSREDQTIEFIEQWCESTWTKLHGEYYDKYN